MAVAVSNERPIVWFVSSFLANHRKLSSSNQKEEVVLGVVGVEAVVMEEQVGDASMDGGDCGGDSEDPNQLPVTSEWLFGVWHEGVNSVLILLADLPTSFSSICNELAGVVASLYLGVTDPLR